MKAEAVSGVTWVGRDPEAQKFVKIVNSYFHFRPFWNLNVVTIQTPPTKQYAFQFPLISLISAWCIADYVYFLHWTFSAAMPHTIAHLATHHCTPCHTPLHTLPHTIAHLTTHQCTPCHTPLHTLPHTIAHLATHHCTPFLACEGKCRERKQRKRPAHRHIPTTLHHVCC